MALDERHLTALLLMSREADDLEHDLASAVPTALHGAHSGSRGPARHLHRARRPLLAAATLVLLASLATVLSVRPGVPRQGNTDVARNRSRGPETTSTHQNMLIALYRAEDGRDAVCPDCWCVQRWEPRWDTAVDVRRAPDFDMLGESIERSCVADPARIVVIGLSGPAESLPASDDQAREIALCLLEGAPDGVNGAGESVLHASSTGCIASTVEYRIQTWNR